MRPPRAGAPLLHTLISLRIYLSTVDAFDWSRVNIENKANGQESGEGESADI